MSYSEYKDMFIKVQNQNLPYRAFMFDVVGSRKNNEYLETKKTKFFKLLDYMYYLLEQEEQKNNKRILLKDINNLKYNLYDPKTNCNEYNPMILGDMITFFVYNNSITQERMLEIFSKALRDLDINYSFHFSSGVYQTNNYCEGGEKLYKGYMPQLLEKISKVEKTIINKDFKMIINEEVI